MAEASFSNVTVTTKANVYFDGRVVSHTLVLASGTKKTLGLIYPGQYHFKTQAAERMEITSGECFVRLDGSERETAFGAGTAFEVPANSGFAIQVKSAIAEYVCTFL